MFYYKIYGLNIASQIELPEASGTIGEIAGDKMQVQVWIQYGKMPEVLLNKRERGYCTSIYLRKYKWFYFEKEGHFLIENGTHITVQQDSTADMKHIRALILGASLGSILHQRGIVAIHGSGVVWRDRAVVFSGASGAGKSTLSGEFRRQGSLFLADDTVAITREEKGFYANPGYPQTKLCTDTALRHGLKLEELILLDEERVKYGLRLRDNFYKKPVKMGAFVFLETAGIDKAVIEEIQDGEKLELLISNLYSLTDYSNGGMNPKAFQTCVDMVSEIPVFRVIRPLTGGEPGDIAYSIIRMLEEQEMVITGQGGGRYE